MKQNVIWAIEYRRTNGFGGKIWKLKDVFLDKPKADQEIVRLKAEPSSTERGWQAEYRLAPYVRLAGKLDGVQHT